MLCYGVHMTVDRARRAMLAIAFSALLVATGCSSLTVDVDRDTTIAIPHGSTWAWGPEPTPNRPEGPDPRVNNSIIHWRIPRAIEAVLEQKGFRRADPAIDILQRSTGRLALRAIGRDTDVTPADVSGEGIQNTVTKMLRDLP